MVNKLFEKFTRHKIIKDNTKEYQHWIELSVFVPSSL